MLAAFFPLSFSAYCKDGQNHEWNEELRVSAVVLALPEVSSQSLIAASNKPAVPAEVVPVSCILRADTSELTCRGELVLTSLRRTSVRSLQQAALCAPLAGLRATFIALRHWDHIVPENLWTTTFSQVEQGQSGRDMILADMGRIRVMEKHSLVNTSCRNEL